MTKNTSVRRGLSVLAAACLAVGAAGVITIPAAQAVDFAGYKPMVPTELTRIVDSRDAKGIDKAPANNDIKEIQVTGDVVPKDADAVVLNMTAVNASEAGYFVAWAADGNRPSTSNINFGAGDTVANGATVPLSAEGKIKLFSRGSADLLLDVAGYYADGTYKAMNAQRALDTRLLATGALEARVPVHVKLPNANEGDLVTLNVTVTEPRGAGYLTVWPTQESAETTPTLTGMPATSNLNYAEGQTIANTVTVKAGKEGMVSLYSMAGTQALVDLVNNVPNKPGTDGKYGTSDDDTSDVDAVANLLSPAQRIMDTRYAIGSAAKTGYREFNLMDQASSTEKNNVGAAIVNVTVTNPKADGFASILMNKPDGAVTTSVLNFKTGQTIANRVVIPANFLGELQAYTNVEADVILDVMGYTKASQATGMKDAMVDLSKAEYSKTYEGTAIAETLNNKTGIALPAWADGLANLDGTDHGAAATPLTDANKATKGIRTFIDGNSVTVVDSAGTEKSVTLVDHLQDDGKNNMSPGETAGAAATDTVADYKLVPLTGLAAGEYTLRVPLKTDHTDASKVMKATYETTFNILPTSGLGAPIGLKSITQTYTVEADAAGADAKITIDGAEKTVTVAADGGGVLQTDTNVQTAIDTRAAAEGVDGYTSDDLTAADGVMTVTTTGYEAGATPVVNTVTEPVALKLKAAGSTVGLSVSEPRDTVKLSYPVNGAAGAVDAITLVKLEASATSKTVYTASADATMLISPQQIAVKLPSGFSAGQADFMVGTKSVKTIASPTTNTDGYYEIDSPSRADFSAKKVELTQDLILRIVDDANTTTMQVDIKIKLG